MFHCIFYHDIRQNIYVKIEETCSGFQNRIDGDKLVCKAVNFTASHLKEQQYYTSNTCVIPQNVAIMYIVNVMIVTCKPKRAG